MKNKFEILGEEVHIHLSRGAVTVIDLKDLDKVQQIPGTWRNMPNSGGRPYVVYSYSGIPGYVRMHRLIMDCPDDLVCDHINGDSLNNKRSNLRVITQGENSQNRDYKVKTSTGVRGVTKTGPNSFRARVGQKHLGSFKTLEEAEKEVVKARKDMLKYDRG